jgi:hypothetical protein
MHIVPIILMVSIFLNLFFVMISLFLLIASVAELADLLKGETQDDYIIGLQDTLSTVFSSPTIFSLAYVNKTNSFCFSFFF